MQQVRESIVDTTLDLAETSSWEGVRLHQVAEELGMSLDQIRLEFSEKEDIVNAWFDRADQAMLNSACDLAQDSSVEHKIELIMMSWFDALSRHQKPTRQMIFNKFEFGHIHYQVLGAMRVSRTVQWMREAAGLEDMLPWRAFSETGFTLIFLATFFYWMFDSSPEYAKTRRFLRNRLKTAGSVMVILSRETQHQN